MEKAWSMRMDSRLDKHFWVESVHTANFLKNLSPSSILGGKTSQEVWSGKKPTVEHLKVFGCEAFTHVPKKKRSKLDNKSVKCIFVGYYDGVKGYRLYIPWEKRHTVSCDLIFKEDIAGGM
eukprot:Gb_34551 [translate_table: standard]